MYEPWFAVYVKCRHEKAVERTLSLKGYETFLPLYQSWHRSSGRWKPVDLPLFPCYVFCRFHPENRLPILITEGVVSLVSNGKSPAPIDENEIETLRTVVVSRFRSQPWPYLKHGDLVRLDDGPLRGAEGVLLFEKNECYLVVSITLLQRSVGVAVDRSWVKPILSLDARVSRVGM